MPDPLIAAALAARLHAFAPFSKFLVGAAIEDSDGRIHTGCNVENATYGLTLCAERVAVFKAISEGERGFDSVAVVADKHVAQQAHELSGEGAMRRKVGGRLARAVGCGTVFPSVARCRGVDEL